jgi:hypothetical protein
MISGSNTEAHICLSLGASAIDAPMDGTIAAVGNTCYGFGEGVRIWLQNVANPQNNFVVQNNIFYTTSVSSYHMRAEFDVGNLVSNNNIFAGFPGLFEYDFGGDLNLTAWTAATVSSSEDNNSIECTPAFFDTNNLDFHLQTSDTCAGQGGADVSSVTTVDYDNETRNVAIGADEKTSP